MLNVKALENYVKQISPLYRLDYIAPNYFEVSVETDKNVTKKIPYTFAIAVVSELKENEDNTKYFLGLLKRAMTPFFSAWGNFDKETLEKLGGKLHFVSYFMVRDVSNGFYNYDFRLYRKKEDLHRYLFSVWNEDDKKYIEYNVPKSLIKSTQYRQYLDVVRVLTNIPHLGEGIFMSAYKEVLKETKSKNLNPNYVKTFAHLKLIPILVNEIRDKNSSLSVRGNGFTILLSPDGTITFNGLKGLSRTLGIEFFGNEATVRLSRVLRQLGVLS